MTEGRHDKPVVSYTPPVPDGPDCPWVRGRRTRWWLVVPADLVAVVAVAVLCAGARHDISLAPEIGVHGVASVVAGWLVAWVATRPEDHLECVGLRGPVGAVGRGGAVVLLMTWLAWVVAHVAAGADDAVSFAAMLACLLVVGLGGWRWLYGFVKAQESVTPRAIRRRMEAQSGVGSDGQE